MERMANLTFQSRGVRILALASIFAITACGGGGGGGEGGTGEAGKLGTGGAGGRGAAPAARSAPGGPELAAAWEPAAPPERAPPAELAAFRGRGGVAGVTGSGGAGGIAGASGAAGMDAAAGAGAMDAGERQPSGRRQRRPLQRGRGLSQRFLRRRRLLRDGLRGHLQRLRERQDRRGRRPLPSHHRGSDPDNECTADTQTSCGLDGVCDGAGACRKWINGTACSSETCSGSTDTPARTCDGTGTCRAATNVSCGNYICGTTSCKTTCLSNADCSTSSFCSSAGHCIAPQTNGAIVHRGEPVRER